MSLILYLSTAPSKERTQSPRDSALSQEIQVVALPQEIPPSPKFKFKFKLSRFLKKFRLLRFRQASASSLRGSTTAKPIFSGVSIFVDGFTVPSSQLDQLANKQSKLSAFFTMRSSKMSEDVLTNSLCQVVSDVEDSSMRVGQIDSEDRNLSKVGEMSEHIG
ncbi:hypothetical protein V8G54_006562 [Vigna mungo]|uniref:Uncharacterized protein n=1 Tax=Vigna mungo TaxID=3915 RepID=A0AAQ3P1K6_VIGMU